MDDKLRELNFYFFLIFIAISLSKFKPIKFVPDLLFSKKKKKKKEKDHYTLDPTIAFT